MPKNSFVLYLDYKKHFDLIQDDGDFRRLIEAIFAYCEDGSEPSNLSPVAEMAFSFVRANLDRDNEKYQTVKEKRKESGRLGGLAKASNAKQSLANASNAKHCLANLADTDTVTVDCNNTPPTPHSGKQEAGTSLLSMCAPSASPSGGCTPIGVQTNGRKKAYSDDFEKFWEKYPRKVNKGAAWKAWQKAKKSGILPDVESLIEALRWRQLEPDWEKDGGKYIPHAATWLNASGWEDEGCKAPEIPQDDPREMRANEIYVKHGVHASPQCTGDAARNVATYKSVIAVIRELREEGLSDYEPYHANLVHWLRTNGLLDGVNQELGWAED